MHTQTIRPKATVKLTFRTEGELRSQYLTEHCEQGWCSSGEQSEACTFTDREIVNVMLEMLEPREDDFQIVAVEIIPVAA